MSLYDNDQTSQSYGLGDRYFWAWGLTDFGNATFIIDDTNVEDHTYSSGRVGLMGIITAGHETPHFADLQLKGKTTESSSLKEITQPSEH